MYNSSLGMEQVTLRKDRVLFVEANNLMSLEIKTGTEGQIDQYSFSNQTLIVLEGNQFDTKYTTAAKITDRNSSFAIKTSLNDTAIIDLSDMVLISQVNFKTFLIDLNSGNTL